MFLRFDRTKTPPEFETRALEYFRELHDRTLELQERIEAGRHRAFAFTLLAEKAEELFKQAKAKFAHLQMMIPEHPEKPTVREQLRELLADISGVLDGFVQELIDETEAFYEYDDLSVKYDQWLHNVAFPQFDLIFKRYPECSVDMVSFDRDLDDFKGVLGAVRRQEAKYYDTMNELIEHYSEVNIDMSDLFKQIEDFDPTLLGA